MPELDDIRAFVGVIEAGGFSAAARRLNVSKSIVSRRIARLEAALGTRLLSRTTRGISATEAGLEFKARGESILLAIEDARDAVAQRGGTIVGRLRVSVPLGFGVRHVAPLLADLAAQHPRLEIDASYTDRIVDLIGERFDVALRIGVLKDSSLIARRIAPMRAALVASPAYLNARGTPRKPADLTRHECLIYTGTTNPDWRFHDGKRWIAVRPQGRTRSDNGDALREAAIAGLGIAMLPTFLLSEAIEAGKLAPVLDDFALPEAGIYVVRPPGAQVPGKVRVFTDLLAARFGGEPYWDPCLMAARAKQRDGGGPHHPPRTRRGARSRRRAAH